MSANLDNIDLNSDVVPVEPENDALGSGVNNPESRDKQNELSSVETLKEPMELGQTHEPVEGEVGNGRLEKESESVVDREIIKETKIESLEEKSNRIDDVSVGEVVQVTETEFVEGEEEVKEGVCPSLDFENSGNVYSANDSCSLPEVDMERKEDDKNVIFPVKDSGHVSHSTENQDMEIDDDRVKTTENQMEGNDLSDPGICKENEDTNKSSALNLVVDLNSYARSDGNESAKANTKVSTSKREFRDSDLVWGKVRSHPWWPGQILDPSSASEKAKKFFRRDSYLIAYYGDQTFAWNDESMIKPFRSHFSRMEKQNNMEEFHYAIDCALDEVSRRVEFGLACPCVPDYTEINTQTIVNAGIGEDFSSREGGDRFSSANAFEPAKFVRFINELGRLPNADIDRLEFVTAQAQLLAFNRWKGYSQLPEFQIHGTLLLNYKIDEPSKKKPVTDDEQISSGKTMSKGQDGSTLKRKNLSGECVSPRKKEKSLAELFAEKRLSTPSSKKGGSGNKAGCKSTSPSSAKKQKVVDSVSNDLSVRKCSKSFSPSQAENKSAQPKRDYRVGDSILRVASQLNGPSPMTKLINLTSQKREMKNITKRKCVSSESESDESVSSESEDDEMSVSSESEGDEKSVSSESEDEIENYSSDEMVSQICLVAKNPMKGFRGSKSAVSFFVGFRNSICSDITRQLDKQSFLEVILGTEEEATQLDAEACNSTDMKIDRAPEDPPDHAKDSCSTDMKIGRAPEDPPDHAKDSCSTDMKIDGAHEDPPSETASQKIIPSEEPAQSSPSLDSEKQGNGEILDMEATEPLSHLKEHSEDDNSSTTLILNFTHFDSIPSESNLNKIFSRFGRLKEPQTKIMKKSNSAKVVFYRRDDAEAAFSSAGKYSTFGPSLVSYRLKYKPSTPSKSPNSKTKRSKKNSSSAEENTS